MSLSARSGCQKSIKEHAEEQGWVPGPRALWEYSAKDSYHHPPWGQPGDCLHTLTQTGFLGPLVSCWAHVDAELLFPSTLIAKTQSGSAWTPVPLSRPPPQACTSHTLTPVKAHSQVNRDSWEVIINITPPKTLNRIDAFELWYWRRLLRVPWTARRSKQ